MTTRPRVRDIIRLADVRAPYCVSVYGSVTDWMRTGTAEGAEVQIRSAEHALKSAGAPREVIASVRSLLEEVASPGRGAGPDRRTRSVAIFVTGDDVELFELTTTPAPWVGVSDRHLIAPLLEAALALVPPVFALVLSENQVRLVDVTAMPAIELDVSGLPRDLATTSSLDLTGDRDTLAHLKTSEDPKVRLAEYARAIDAAVAPVFRREHALLIVAATEPLAGIYRDITSIDVIASSLPGNHDGETPGRLAELAAPLIERHRREVLEQHLERFAEMPARDHVLVGLDEIEDAVGTGAVDTLFVDSDRRLGIPAQAFGMHLTLDRVDEVVRAALAHGSTVVPVRAGDLPTPDPVAAVLRYAPAVYPVP